MGKGYDPREEEVRLERKRHEAFGRLLRDNDGRTIITWLLEITNVYHACATPEMEGKRRVGLEILLRCNDNPDAYLDFIKKNFDDAKVREQLIANLQQQDKEENENEFDHND